MAWTPPNQDPNQDPNQNQGPYQNPNPGNPSPGDPYSAPQEPYQQPNYTESSFGNPQNPYGTPPPQNPYGAPQNPYGTPQYGYEAPQDPYSQYSGISQAPKDTGSAIKDLPQQWIRAITRPSAMTFAQEMGKATWPMVWIQLAIYAVVGALLSFLARLLSSASTAVPSGLTGTSAATYQNFTSFFYSPATAIATLIISPLFYLLGMLILFGMAKAFRGEGNYKTQTYTSLLFAVPLSIISGLLALIPILGGIVSLAIGIYQIVLQIFVIMPVHRLSGGKATWVVLLPI
ncbi:MAG TPA: YIP1 family protein, partial [Ktedonobacteraceae bacterium]|nr:YIP1 family protein [Ktedonobacteraceae bacterium]